MRIPELIEPTITVRQSSRPIPKKLGSQVNKLAHYDPQGTSGSYATVRPDPHDPHMYRKKTRLPSKLHNDAYYNYIVAIGPYMGLNPYFP